MTLAAVPGALRGASGGSPGAAAKPPEALAAAAAGYTGAAGAPPLSPSVIQTIGKSVLGYPVTRPKPNRHRNLQASDTKKTISAIEEIAIEEIMKNLQASPEDLTAHLNTIAEKIPQFKAVIESILECAKNPDLSNQDDLLDKIKTSLDELKKIVNEKPDSKDKLDKLDAIIKTAEKISRRLTDEAADPAEAEAGQAQQLTAEEAIAIIAVAIVSCVGNVYACVKCNEGFANTFNRFCCFLDPCELWIVPRLVRIDERIGYRDGRVAPNLGTTTLGQPVNLTGLGGLGTGIELP